MWSESANNLCLMRKWIVILWMNVEWKFNILINKERIALLTLLKGYDREREIDILIF